MENGTSLVGAADERRFTRITLDFLLVLIGVDLPEIIPLEFVGVAGRVRGGDERGGVDGHGRGDSIEVTPETRDGLATLFKKRLTAVVGGGRQGRLGQFRKVSVLKHKSRQ